MSRFTTNEDCERKKENVIRSSCQDVPPLAPEEDESFDSTRSHIHRPPTDTPEAPERHSPSLIIESEPNRHDERSEVYRQVTFKADVKKSIEDDLEAGDENSEILERKRVSDNINNQSSIESEATKEIEMMRTPRIHPSIGSVHEANITADSHQEHIELEQDPNQHEAETEISSSDPRESTDMEVNFYFLHRVSTAIERNISYSNSGSVTNTIENVTIETSRECSRRRKSSTASSVSSKRMRYVDAGVQTSFDYEQGKRGVLFTLNDIFVGTPRVIRLCWSVNHFCG